MYLVEESQEKGSRRGRDRPAHKGFADLLDSRLYFIKVGWLTISYGARGHPKAKPENVHDRKGGALGSRFLLPGVEAEGLPCDGLALTLWLAVGLFGNVARDAFEKKFANEILP